MFVAGADFRMLFDFITPTGFEERVRPFDADRELGGVGVTREVRPMLLPQLLSATPSVEAVGGGEGFEGWWG